MTTMTCERIWFRSDGDVGMVRLTMKRAVDTTELCLGYRRIELLFNAGTLPAGGNCLIVRADGELNAINSNDLIADLEAYELSEPDRRNNNRQVHRFEGRPLPLGNRPPPLPGYLPFRA